jgi:hypothetical protein
MTTMTIKHTRHGYSLISKTKTFDGYVPAVMAILPNCWVKTRQDNYALLRSGKFQLAFSRSYDTYFLVLSWVVQHGTVRLAEFSSVKSVPKLIRRTEKLIQTLKSDLQALDVGEQK